MFLKEIVKILGNFYTCLPENGRVHKYVFAHEQLH